MPGAAPFSVFPVFLLLMDWPIYARSVLVLNCRLRAMLAQVVCEYLCFCFWRCIDHLFVSVRMCLLCMHVFLFVFPAGTPLGDVLPSDCR